jgi:hypothetical protein
LSRRHEPGLIGPEYLPGEAGAETFATGMEQRIENNGSGFYRINLSPEQIKIDFDSMKSFCDLELAELTKQVEGQSVC